MHAPRSLSRPLAALLSSFSIVIITLSACTLNLADTPHPDNTLPDTISPVTPGQSEGEAFPARYSATIPAIVEGIPITANPDTGKAESGDYITDAVYDPVTNQIYASDSLGRITVVDATSYAILHTFEVWGYLHLDVEARRLYVAPDEFPLPPDIEPAIAVFDLGSKEGDLPIFVAALAGMSLSQDDQNNRLFVGEPLTFGEAAAANTPVNNGVRIYDGGSLNLIGQSSQSGRPLYNPVRDELLIVAYTVYIADAQSGEIRGELPILPADEEPFLWCSGCTWATSAYVLADEGKIGVLAHPQAARQYASYPLIAFDAATLAPLPERILHEDRGPDCGNPLTLHLPTQVDDQTIHHAFEANYIVENFLQVYARDAVSPTATIAGISPVYVDAQTGQVTTADGLLIDLATLVPVTLVEPLCIFGTLPDGRLFGRSLPPRNGGSHLRIVTRTKVEIDRPQPMASAGVLGYEVAEILVPSQPSGIETLFVRTEYESGLFRSQDGGTTWAMLDMGLPWDLFEGMSIQLSPDFANDQTLFVAGPNVHHRGLGVWISVDGGETWHPRWQGLDDLRIASLLVSPSFSMDGGKGETAGEQRATDQSLIAQSVAGKIYRTTDAGKSWIHLANADQTGTFESLAHFLTDDPADQPSVDANDSQNAPMVRIDLITGDLVYRTGQGDSETWVAAPIELPPLPNGSPQHWTRVIAAPDDPYTVYALTERTIWRTLDGGINWLPIEMVELETLPDDAYLRTATLVGDAYGGGTTLVVGTSHGEVWQLGP